MRISELSLGVWAAGTIINGAIAAAVARTPVACVAGPVKNTRCRVECGVDYPGGDYSQSRVTSFSACVSACDQDKQCTDAQYHEDNGYCYLKNRLSSARKVAGVDSIICDGKSVTSSTMTTTTTINKGLPPNTIKTTTTTTTTTTINKGFPPITNTIKTTTTTTTTTTTVNKSLPPISFPPTTTTTTKKATSSVPQTTTTTTVPSAIPSLSSTTKKTTTTVPSAIPSLSSTTKKTTTTFISNISSIPPTTKVGTSTTTTTSKTATPTPCSAFPNPYTSTKNPSARFNLTCNAWYSLESLIGAFDSTGFADCIELCAARPSCKACSIQRSSNLCGIYTSRANNPVPIDGYDAAGLIEN